MSSAFNVSLSVTGSKDPEYAKYNEYISIQSNSDYINFFKQAQADMEKIASKPRGARLVSAINRFSVKINHHPQISIAVPEKMKEAKTGVGCGATISYPANTQDSLNFVRLAHELCHAYHIQRGIFAVDEPLAENQKARWKNAEELNTVGPLEVQDPNDFEFTENGIRDEWGFEKRASYCNEHETKNADDSNDANLDRVLEGIQQLGFNLAPSVEVVIKTIAR